MIHPITSIFSLPPARRTMIEANAGTGKTYTIVGLYVRMLVEQELDVSELLVVTFTRKATAELRDRIFERLQECLSMLESCPGREEAARIDDAFLREFVMRAFGWADSGERVDGAGGAEQASEADARKRVDGAGGAEQASETDAPERVDGAGAKPHAPAEQWRTALHKAIRDFDESQVFTIHGFCQRVLSEEALLAGAPFEMQISQHDEALEQAVEDYWRSFVYAQNDSKAGPLKVQALLSLAESPAELRIAVESLINREQSEIETGFAEGGGQAESEVAGLNEKLADTYESLATMWKEQRGQVLQAIADSDLSRYTENSLKRWLENVDTFLQQEMLLNVHAEHLHRFSWSTIVESKKKKGPVAVEHPFFKKVDRFLELLDRRPAYKTLLLQEAAGAIRHRRNLIAARSGTVTYDDLVSRVRQALAGGPNSRFLAARLRKKFRIALVDEFQDTDRNQYAIFSTIWSEEHSRGSLFMIGDPKQAIYGFRGAEIFTYLQARREYSGKVYSLDHNYRSSAGLIEAVNKACRLAGNPFHNEEIAYFDSKPGLADAHTHWNIEGKPAPPFRVVALEGVHSNKQVATDAVIEQTVSEIASRLQRGARGEITIGKDADARPLMPGDIAVLVDTHKVSEEIKRRLRRIGIGAVTYSREKVFESYEASRLERLMAAVLEPFQIRRLSSALLTGFFGHDLQELNRQYETAEFRTELSNMLQELRDVWMKKGFYPMMYELLSGHGAMEHLAAQENGDRILTNVLHLSDICSLAERKGGLDSNALLSWFRKEMNSDDNDEEKTLLLESDEHLVKLSTIHNSKGLQFPVVFCPTLWSSVLKDKAKDLALEYHHVDTDTGGLLTKMNIDQQESTGRAQALRQRNLELVAEGVRQGYVALTRARYECTVVWATHSASYLSALGALLAGASHTESFMEVKAKQRKPISEALFPGVFEQLAQECGPEVMEYVLLSGSKPWTERVDLAGGEQQTLTARAYRGPVVLEPRNRLESFSSLVRKEAVPAEPDYDQHAERYAEMIAEDHRHRSRDIFGFPMGSVAGTAVHKLFEHEEFDFSRAAQTATDALAAEVLQQYGIDEQWVPVAAQMMRDVAGCQAGPLHLSHIHPEECIRELEFHFLSRRADSEQLYACIRQGAGDSHAHTPPGGLMNGFIDLVVRQNGTYYLLDYKSNFLGKKLEDYTQQRVAEAVRAAGYDLQYHIYLVALVRYLQVRLPDFDYDRHIGGAAYLFVRGMRPGSQNGIFFDRPSRQVISRLEAVLCREPETEESGR